VEGVLLALRAEAPMEYQLDVLVQVAGLGDAKGDAGADVRVRRGELTFEAHAGPQQTDIVLGMQ
jgi:hypothetical protein